MDVLLKTRCVGGHLVIYPDKVAIEMKMLGSHNINALLAEQVTGVEVKTTYAKVPIISRGASTVTIYAKGDQKLIAKLVMLDDAKKAEELINNMIRNQGKISSSSSVDDLEKLAALKEKGIITQEEFEAKKKQLLGL